MSVRDALPAELRDGAHALRTTASRVGLAAWGSGRTCGSVAQWTGPHSQAWRERALHVVASGRGLETVLRDLASAVEEHARAVEAAQQALDALDAEAADVERALARELARWEATSGPGRPRPDAWAARLRLSARRQEVEQAAEADAAAFARRVDALLAALRAGPSEESVLRALTGSPAYAFGYALPSGLAGVGAAAAGARGWAVPRAVRLPLAVLDRVSGPVGLVGDVLALRAPQEEGVRDDLDRVAAVTGLAATGATLAAGGVAVAPAVVTGLGLAAVGYGVVTGLHDLGRWAVRRSAAPVSSGSRGRGGAWVQLRGRGPALAVAPGAPGSSTATWGPVPPAGQGPTAGQGPVLQPQVSGARTGPSRSSGSGP